MADQYIKKDNETILDKYGFRAVLDTETLGVKYNPRRPFMIIGRKTERATLDSIFIELVDLPALIKALQGVVDLENKA